MKICHLTSVHLYTDTRILLKECSTLAANGFDVTFVVPNAPNETINDVKISGFDAPKGSRLTRMTKTTNAVYAKALEVDADLYHFHDPELMPVGLKLKKKGKKVIYDIHEDLPRAILSKHWIKPFIRKPMSVIVEWYENYAAKKFDCLMTATPFITKRFMRINSNTININNYPLLTELENNSIERCAKKRQVCYVGGLGVLRGSEQLLQAADLINGALVIAGPLSPKELEHRVLEHASIDYKGFLNRNAVKELLGDSVAGIVTFLPEPNHINAQPNKMFEYMSAGIPVICSDFPLWRSIIEKHDCGICVNPENSREIAEAINYLLDHPEIAERMGRNGRQAVETEYNWEHEGQKLVKFYQSLA